MNRRGGPGRQGLQLSAAMGVSQVLVAVAYAVAARNTSPGELGLTLSIVAMSAVLASLTDFGQNSYLTREVARGTIENDSMYRRLVQKMLLTAIFGVLLASVFSGFSLPRWQDFPSPIVAVGLLIMTSLSQCAQVPVRAHGKAGTLSLGLLMDRLTFLAGVVAGSFWGINGSKALVAGLLLGLLSNTAVSLVAAFRDEASRPTTVRAVTPGHTRLWKGAWNGTRGYGFATAVAASQQLDTPLLGLSSGASAAGEYGAVSRWTLPLTLPASALVQVGVAHTAAQSSAASALRLMAKSWWLLALGLAASLAVVPLASLLTALLLGEQYAGAAPVLTILAFAAIPSLVNQPLAMVLQTRGFEFGVSLMLGVGLVVRLGSCLLIGALLGSLAAAIGVLVQQMLLLVGLVLVLSRVIKSEGRSIPVESVR